MEMYRCEKEAFVVIGKEGSTADGEDFIQRLWEDANGHFDQVAHLAKKDEQGNLIGVWGVMSDCSRSFAPWENGFTKGLYLAGVECTDEVEAPDGWTKWKVPGYEYLCVEKNADDTFPKTIQYFQEQKWELAGAVHDFTCPTTGKEYLYFPIRKL